MQSHDDVVVRKAVASDHDFVVLTGCKDILEFESCPFDDATRQAYSDMFWRLFHEGGVLIATCHNQHAGFVLFEQGVSSNPVTNEQQKDYFFLYNWISMVYTSPQHRRKGVAASLYAEVDKVSSSKGRDIFLDVYDHNVGSLAFHENVGYVVHGYIVDRDLSKQKQKETKEEDGEGEEISLSSSFLIPRVSQHPYGINYPDYPHPYTWIHSSSTSQLLKEEDKKKILHRCDQIAREHGVDHIKTIVWGPSYTPLDGFQPSVRVYVKKNK